MQRLVFTSVVLALSAGLSLAQTATTAEKNEIKVNYGAAGGMKLDPTTTGVTSKTAQDCTTNQQASSTTSTANSQTNAAAPKC
jgi:hypothetical protein